MRMWSLGFSGPHWVFFWTRLSSLGVSWQRDVIVIPSGLVTTPGPIIPSLNSLKLSQHLTIDFPLFSLSALFFNMFYMLIWLFKWIARFSHDFSFFCSVYLWTVTMNIVSPTGWVDATHLSQWYRGALLRKHTSQLSLVTQRPGDIISPSAVPQRTWAESSESLNINKGEEGVWREVS